MGVYSISSFTIGEAVGDFRAKFARTNNKKKSNEELSLRTNLRPPEVLIDQAGRVVEMIFQDAELSILWNKAISALSFEQVNFNSDGDVSGFVVRIGSSAGYFKVKTPKLELVHEDGGLHHGRWITDQAEERQFSQPPHRQHRRVQGKDRRVHHANG